MVLRPTCKACFEDALWMTQSAPTIHDGMNFGSARSRNFRRSASRIASAFRTSSAEAVRGEGSKIPAARRSLVVTIPDGCRVACLKSDRQQVMYQLFPTGKRRAERVAPSRPSYLYLPDSLREMHIALLTSPRDFSPEPDNAALLARRKRAVSGVARRYYGGRPVRSGV